MSVGLVVPTETHNRVQTVELKWSRPPICVSLVLPLHSADINSDTADNERKPYFIKRTL